MICHLIMIFILCLFSLPISAHSFVVTKSVALPNLQGHLTELEHSENGLRVVHIAAPDPENFFAITFSTPPKSSNGAPHILEHALLEGSEKYPVPNLFFHLTARTLASFLNALTGPDRTAYVAASRNREDFYNLFNIYLDAVFHPLLSPLTFAQEGHRLEFRTPDDATTPLEVRGIVYNEMKGALSSPYTRLAHILMKRLYPGSPYAYNAGGNPVGDSEGSSTTIVDLSYEELLAFYNSHYYAGNCLIFLYGNIPLEEHLAFLQTQQFGSEQKKAQVSAPLLKRAPKQVRDELFYPSSNATDSPIMGIAWATVSTTDRFALMALDILNSILMESDAALLKSRLLKSGLCTDAHSTITKSHSRTSYSLYIDGCNVAEAERLERTVQSVFDEVAEKGIDPELVASAIERMQLATYEIRACKEPFGLQLFQRNGTVKLYGGDLEEALRIDLLLEKLKASPHVLEELVREYFLDNAERVSILFKPSQELAHREFLEERTRLDEIQKGLTEDEISTILAQSQALFTESNRREDRVDLIPKCSLEHAFEEDEELTLTEFKLDAIDVLHHNTFTNHIVYANLFVTLPEMPIEDIWLLRLYCELVPELGSGGRSYKDTLAFIHRATGGLNTSIQMRHSVQWPTLYYPQLVFSAKALDTKQESLFSLLFESITSVDFSDKARLKELVIKEATVLQNSMSHLALDFATIASLASTNFIDHAKSEWVGLDYFYHIQELKEHFDTSADTLIEKLQNIQAHLIGRQKPQLIVVGAKEVFNQAYETGFGGLTTLYSHSERPWKAPIGFTKKPSRAYCLSSPVAFTAQACKTHLFSHPDSALLALTAEILKHGILHKRIREQGGAYGGGARYAPTTGVFVLYASRDPHIGRTAHIFEEALIAIANGEFTDDELYNARLQVAKAQTSPLPVKSQAISHYLAEIEGITPEMIDTFNNVIKQARREDIQRVVTDYILPAFKESVLVSFAGKELLDKELDLGILPVDEVCTLASAECWQVSGGK